MAKLFRRAVGSCVLLLGGIAAIGGGLLGTGEFRALRLNVNNVGDVLAAQNIQSLSWVSTNGQYAVVQACWRGTRGIEGLLSIPEDRRRVAAVCREGLAAIVRVAPANAFALAFDAYLAAMLDDASGFRWGIARSAEIAPHESWLAQHRFEAVEVYLDAANAETLAVERLDIATLAASYARAQVIARRYVRDPQFRERVTIAVEGLSDSVKRRFVRNVQRAMDEIGLRRL